MSLSSHANVYNTCLRILRERGFELRVDGDLTDDGAVPADHFWFATNNEVQLTADNPIELLGLAAIYDRKKPVADEPYWWVVEGNDIWDELYENAWGPFGDD